MLRNIWLAAICDELFMKCCETAVYVRKPFVAYLMTNEIIFEESLSFRIFFENPTATPYALLMQLSSWHISIILFLY